jgi:hypothetical protein
LSWRIITRNQLATHADSQNQGLFQAVFAVIQSLFNIIFSIFHGAITVAWDLIESVASFVGASAYFVFCA